MRLKQNTLKKVLPTILSCVGTIGVVATTILAVKATPKALKRMKKVKEGIKNGEQLTTMETIATCWQCYIPAAIMGITTIGCIFGANMLNRSQQASLVSAYAILNRSYTDYKRKLKELYGENAHKQIMESLAVEKAKEDITIYSDGGFYSSSLIFEKADEEKRVFYDQISDRLFESTIGNVLQAEYHLNRNLVLRGDVRLNEFYDFLGIERIEGGDAIGWFIDDKEIYWADFNHEYTTLDDGLQGEIDCWIIDPLFEPYTPSEDW